MSKGGVRILVVAEWLAATLFLADLIMSNIMNYTLLQERIYRIEKDMRIDALSKESLDTLYEELTRLYTLRMQITDEAFREELE